MADVAVSNTFVASTVISSSAMNTNFSDLVTYINNRNTGSATWDALRVTTASAVPLVVNNSTGVSNIANFQDNGTNVLSIADGGATTLTATAGGTSVPLTVDNSTSTGSILVAKDNGSAVFTIADGGAITTTGAVSVGGALTVTGATTLSGSVTIAPPLRRPNLTYIGVTTIDVESNTGTANQTAITFPDGNTRSVTEDTSSTHKYRRFLITATAEFTAGTEDSGLYSSLSEAANTWYAIYAVKSAIDSTKFVLVGDTTLPIQANFSTLNTRYASNGWVYLGMIRNGDAGSATTDLLNFEQTGNITYFRNTHGDARVGLRIAAVSPAATLTYTYSAGTGASDVPNHCLHSYFQITVAGGATTRVLANDSGGARLYFSIATSNDDITFMYWAASKDGVALSNVGAASVNQRIYLSGFSDAVLGVSPNSVI